MDGRGDEAWSHYLDRHDQSPGGYYGDEFAWKDVITVEPRRSPLVRAFQSFLDGTYHPSPVPPQVGRSNYVDNDRLGATLGTDYEVRVRRDIACASGISGQAQRLIARYQAKQNNLIRDEVPDGAVDKSLNPIPGVRRGFRRTNSGRPGFGSEGLALRQAASGRR